MALSLIGFASLGAVAADPHFELNGLRIGTPQAEVAALVNYEPDCSATKPPKPFDHCYYERRDSRGRKLDTLAEEPIDGWGFEFADGRLGYVTAIFPHESFATIKKAMLSRYGKPSRSHVESMHDADGTFKSEDLEWFRGDEILHAKEYAGDRRKAQVSLASIDFLIKRRHSGKSD